MAKQIRFRNTHLECKTRDQTHATVSTQRFSRAALPLLHFKHYKSSGSSQQNDGLKI